MLLGVVIIKETLFRFMRRVARAEENVAVFSDAWHQRSDAITSAAAAIGIGIAVFGGREYAAAEDWAALLASGVILFNGYRLTRAPLQELMDTQPTDTINRVWAVAETEWGWEPLTQAERLLLTDTAQPATTTVSSPPDIPSTDRRNRETMLNRVRAYWIDGILEHSLYRGVFSVDLDFDQRDRLSYTVGRYHAEARSGPEEDKAGHFILVLKHSGGEWKIRALVFS